MKLARAGGAVALLMSVGVHAQTAPATTAPAATPVFGLMQGVLGLLIVLGLIFAAGWLMKRIGPRGRTTGVVQVVGGASVGPREKVVVVRFGSQTLLLGVAPGHVGLLHVAGPDASFDASPPPEADGAPTFVERLRAARSGS